MYNTLQVLGVAAGKGTQSFVAYSNAVSRMSESQLVNLMITNNQALGVNRLTSQQMKRALTEAGVSEEIAKSTVAQVAQTEATNAQTVAATRATAATGGLKTAATGLWQVIKANPLISIMATAAVVIPLVVSLWKKLNVTLEEHVERLQEIETELSNTTSELDTVKSRIEELNDLGHLSITEQSELEQLEAQNEILEAQIVLLKEKHKLEAEEANPKTLKELTKTVDRAVDDAFEINQELYGDARYSSYQEQGYSAAESAYLVAIQRLRELQQQRNQIAIEGGDVFEIDNAISHYRRLIQEVSSAYGEAADTFVVFDDETRKVYQVMAGLLKMGADVLAGVNPAVDALDYALNTSKFGHVRSELVALAEAGQLTSDTFGSPNYDAFIDYLVEAGVVADNSEESLQSIVDHVYSLVRTTEELFSFNPHTFEEVLEGIQDGFDALADAQEEMKDAGYLSIKTVKAIQDAGLSEYLVDVEGGYQLTEGALQDYIDAQRAEYQTVIAKAQVSASKLVDMQALAAAGYNTTTMAIYDQIKAMEKLARIAMVQAEEELARLQANGASGGLVLAADNTYQTRLSEWRALLGVMREIGAAEEDLAQYDQIINTLMRDDENERKSKSDDPWKDAFEKQYDAHKHAVAMEKETLAEFYAWLDGADGYKKYFANNEKYIDEFRKYAEEVFEGYKDLISDTIEDSEHQIFLWEKQGDQEDKIIAKYREMQNQVHETAETIRASMRAAGYSLEEIENNASIQELQKQWWEFEDAIQEVTDTLNEDLKDSLESLIELTEDMIRQQKEDEIEALEETTESYKKIVDARKELLQLAEREREYTDSVAEKTKELAKLEAQRTALQLAANTGDRNAALQLGKVNEEIAELQKELSDEQRDHYVENVEDQLDKEVESFETAQDAKIKAIQDFLDDNEAVNKAALDRLQNMNQQLYTELESYALHYTDTTRAELQKMWADATEAAKKYGSVANALSAVTGDKTPISSATNNVASVRTIVSQMEENSKSWHSLMTVEEKDALHADSVAKAASLVQYGVTAQYDSAHGKWYIASDSNDPSNAGKKLFDIYHSGGVVGGSAVATPKQNELFALLQRREIVLNEAQQDRLLSLISASAPVRAIQNVVSMLKPSSITSSAPAMVDASLHIDGYLPDDQMMSVLKRHQRDVANIVSKYFKP